MAVHKCPVCNGRGTVRCEFYGEEITTGGDRLPCRACGGKGVIITLEPPILGLLRGHGGGEEDARLVEGKAA